MIIIFFFCLFLRSNTFYAGDFLDFLQILCAHIFADIDGICDFFCKISMVIISNIFCTFSC